MRKILVVDDTAFSREAVLTLLEDEGYQAIEAGDGVEGLRVAEKEQPHLVISDILMPSMDGYEFVRQLRSNPTLGQIPVIFYTANYHSREARNLAQLCGVAHVLVKPCGARELLDAVAEGLAGVGRPMTQPIDREFDREHLQLMTDTLSNKSDELEALNSRFAALTELNVQLASERNPYVLLERVCAGARTLLGAKYAILAIADRLDSNAPKVWNSGMDRLGGPAPINRIDEGLPGQAYSQRRTIRASRLEITPGDLPLPSSFPPASSALAAPINSLTQTYGWLCLIDKLGLAHFDANDEHMLGTLGAQVGRVYENGRLSLEVQRHLSGSGRPL